MEIKPILFNTEISWRSFERTFDFARPKMYELGYANNNCVGCVKAAWVIGIISERIFRKSLKVGRSWKEKSDTPC